MSDQSVDMIGADPEQLKRLASALRRGADQIRQLRGQLDSGVGALGWRGLDADGFSADWARVHRCALDATAVALSEAAGTIARQAQEQLQASRVESAASPAPLFGVSVQVPVGVTGPEAHEWWTGLSESDRAWLILHRPELLGAMNGVPAAVRDQCNRALLARAVEQCHISGETGGKCEDILALRELLTAEHRQLISFSTTGEQVLAGVVVGDADTAPNIVVMVPGMETDIHGEMGSLINQADHIAIDKSQVAVVAWLGYDTPSLNEEVLSASKAEIGAASLSEFLIGLDPQERRHISVFGHSYGSVVTAVAARSLAQQHQNVIDSAVFYGSPGLPIHSASELGIPPGRAYTMRGPTDMVARVGYFGDPPEQIEGFQPLSSAGPEWQLSNLGVIENHSHYGEGDGDSLRNLQLIAAGRTDVIAPHPFEWVASHAEELATEAMPPAVKAASRVIRAWPK